MKRLGVGWKKEEREGDKGESFSLSLKHTAKADCAWAAAGVWRRDLRSRLRLPPPSIAPAPSRPRRPRAGGGGRRAVTPAVRADPASICASAWRPRPYLRGARVLADGEGRGREGPRGNGGRRARGRHVRLHRGGQHGDRIHGGVPGTRDAPSHSSRSWFASSAPPT
uniref:Uncharacterized protein n=1 Tax=Setaria viridis TaxID=4556 RepID=A0A4U6UGT2_SETVI|nr:hypothetical protein SEVIR_6G118650v2 [Setaria viridis]